MQKFKGTRFGKEPLPDETTLLKFPHLLEENNKGSLKGSIEIIE